MREINTRARGFIDKNSGKRLKQKKSRKSNENERSRTPSDVARRLVEQQDKQIGSVDNVIASNVPSQPKSKPNEINATSYNVFRLEDAELHPLDPFDLNIGL